MEYPFSISFDGAEYRLDTVTPPPVTDFFTVQVRKWGDPILIEDAGLSVSMAGVNSNFQVVPLYCPEDPTWSAVAKWARLEHDDVMKLSEMQVADARTVDEKMRWLIYSGRGTRPMWTDDEQYKWYEAPFVKAGVMVYGGQLLKVDGKYYEFVTKLPNKSKDSLVIMTKIVGYFNRSDFGNVTYESDPAIVVKATAAGAGDKYNESPRGTIYSPVWFNPAEFKLLGNVIVEAYYIPIRWLEST